MIESNTNIYKDGKLNKVVEVDQEFSQITLHDSRYYQREPGVFYPSVTTVLGYFPKNKFFESWLKDVGHNADIIMRRAGDEGTQVHNALEDYLKGTELRWIERNGHVNYKTDVWKMILKTVDFWETYKPELVASESLLFSDEIKYAGTTDLIVRIDGKLWLIDLKTSNSLHTSYFLQLAAYKQAWFEMTGDVIDEVGILWVKSSKRGPDKKGVKMQGKGWEIVQGERTHEEYLDMFKFTHSIFRLDNKDDEIELVTLPNTVKLS